MTRRGSWALLCVGSMALGCRVQGGIHAGPGTGSSGSGAPGSEGGVVAGGPGGGTGGPSCVNPANHCLEEGETFVTQNGFESGYVDAFLAKPTGPANGQGEAEYLSVADGQTMRTKWVWQTRPATDADLQVGRMAIMLDQQENGIYHAPRTRDEAKSGNRWFLARIVNVDTKPQGYVVVSGPYKVANNAVRVLVKDDSPTLKVSGAVDKHYLHDDYWLVGEQDLAQSGYIDVRIGVAIKPPAKETGNEGQFLLIPSGKIVWSKYAWKTRPANKDEIKIGIQAFMLDDQHDGVYHAPESLENAFAGAEWFAAKVVDTGTLYKGVVGVAGGYNVAIDAIRVRK
jgi:hypothetical protein